MAKWKRATRRWGQRFRPRSAIPGADTDFRHAAQPEELRRGHVLQMLVDGSAAFPAMLEAIRGATKSIWFETYIFESDETGTAFVEALAERARAGLEVLLLVDAFGGLRMSGEHINELRHAGVELRFFGRFNHKNLSRWLNRDHRKLLLIDNQSAFLGGINISHEYVAQSDGGKGWHDIHVRVQGPVCASLARTFSEIWQDIGGSALKLPEVPPQHDQGEWAMALSSNHRGVRMKIRDHLLHAIRYADSEVILASAYFIPDRGLLRSLQEAASRGVDVRVLVPGSSDLQSVQWAGEHVYEPLLKHGVQIHQWGSTHMHAKAAVVDSRWCMFGSYNLDFVSLLYNLELVIEVVGDQTPAQLAQQLRADCDKSERVEASMWEERPVSHKLRSSFAYRFRRWL